MMPGNLDRVAEVGSCLVVMVLCAALAGSCQDAPGPIAQIAFLVLAGGAVFFGMLAAFNAK